MKKLAAGKWVQIYQIILPSGERAPQVPEDTGKVPLELRVAGFLVDDGVVGEEVEIETLAGRRLRGIMKNPDPSYEHKFGRPVPEILRIGKELKAMLKEGEV